MISLFSSLILATTLIGPRYEPCPETQEAFYEADRALFEDPSEANRRALTEKLLPSALGSYRTLDALRRPGTGPCVMANAMALIRIGDRSLVIPVIREQAKLYHDLAVVGAQQDPRFSESVAGRELQELQYIGGLADRIDSPSLGTLRQACVDPSNVMACQAEALVTLILSGEPVDRDALGKRGGIVERALLEWMTLLEVSPDRSTALAAALDPQFADDAGSGLSARKLVRKWAADQLLVGADPRRWDPGSIAAVVRAARDADAAAVAARSAEKSTGGTRVIYFGETDRCATIDEETFWAPRRSELPPSESTIQGCRLREFLGRLAPMGQERAFELVAPTSTVRASTSPWSSPHFPRERSAYEGDWRAPADVTPAESKKQKEKYLAERWLETDRRAPAPDLDAVQKRLAKKPHVSAQRPKKVSVGPPLPRVEPEQAPIDRRECCENGAPPCTVDLRPRGFNREPAGTCAGDERRFAPLLERVFSSSEVLPAPK